MTSLALAPEPGFLDQQRAKPARWLVILAATQVAALSLDFSKLGLTSRTGTDIGRWLVIAPGQVLLGTMLLVLSPHLLRVLRDLPGTLMMTWLAWNFMTAWWSVDPRQTVIQTVGALNLFLLGAWFVYVFGITNWARISAAGIGIIVVAGAYWQWLSADGPGFDQRFEGLAQGFNVQGLLCAYAILAAAIALQGSERFRRTIWAGIIVLFALLISTGGRMGMVAILAALAVLVSPKLLAPKYRYRTLAAATVAFVGSLMVLPGLDVYQRREDDGALNGRDIVWSYAADLVADSPLVGHGMMAGESIWKAAVVAGALDFSAGSAHNMVIDVAVGGGVVGLFLLLIALAVITLRLWQARSAVGLSLMVLILLAGLTESLVHRPGLAHWMLGALVALATQLKEPASGEPTDGRAEPRPVVQPLLGARR